MVYVVLLLDKTDDPDSSWKDETWEEEPYDIFASSRKANKYAKELRETLALDKDNQKIIVRREVEGVYM